MRGMLVVLVLLVVAAVALVLTIVVARRTPADGATGMHGLLIGCGVSIVFWAVLVAVIWYFVH